MIVRARLVLAVVCLACVLFWNDPAAASSCSMDGPGPDVTFVGTAVAVTDRPEWSSQPLPEHRPIGTRARFAVEEIWQEPAGIDLGDRVDVRAGGPELSDGVRSASWSPPLFEPGERYLVGAVTSSSEVLTTEMCRADVRLWSDAFVEQRPANARLVDQPDEIATEPWSPGPPWRAIAVVAILLVAGALARLVWVGERSGYEPTARRGGARGTRTAHDQRPP